MTGTLSMITGQNNMSQVISAVQCVEWYYKAELWYALHLTWECVSLNARWTSCSSHHPYYKKDLMKSGIKFCVAATNTNDLCIYIISYHLRLPIMDSTYSQKSTHYFWIDDILKIFVGEKFFVSRFFRNSPKRTFFPVC